MIVFLNFAPIEFMGGAEKWMLDMASKATGKEEVVLIDVSPVIANIYGKLVLKRSFESHLDKNSHKNNINRLKRIKLTSRHFLPFTKEWHITRGIFKKARLIYLKFELWEVLINLYFNGWLNTRKVIAGVQSPLLYTHSNDFFSKLHNFLYSSKLCKFYLSNTRLIHVLNWRDEKFLHKNFMLKNVYKLPDGIHIQKYKHKEILNNKKSLQIIFVGVLSFRKGIDTLCEVIKNSPPEFSFHIVGDGPMKQEINNLTDGTKCTYHGYVTDQKLYDLYNHCDVILFPSRSESLGLVLLEAISFGLQTIVPEEISLNLPRYIEHVATSRNHIEYIKILKNITRNKVANRINRIKIRKYAINNFSTDIIYPMFLNKILGL